MPPRAKKPCSYPGCKILVSDGGSKCEKHRVAWQKRDAIPNRQTGRALQDARARLFRRSPLCAQCEREGRVRVATIRDHVVSLAEGGEDNDGNTQGLCTTCHDAKSLEERKRGLRR